MTIPTITGFADLDMGKLRQLAGEVEYSAKWYTADELTERRAMERADAKYVAALPPKTCLALLDTIASLQERAKGYDAQHARDSATLREYAAARDDWERRANISKDNALWMLNRAEKAESERDALRQEWDEAREKHETVGAMYRQRIERTVELESHLSVLTARLKEAEGLVREAMRLLNGPAHLAREQAALAASSLTWPSTWTARADAFLQTQTKANAANG